MDDRIIIIIRQTHMTEFDYKTIHSSLSVLNPILYIKPVPIQVFTYTLLHTFKIAYAIKPVPKPVPSAQPTIRST